MELPNWILEIEKRAEDTNILRTDIPKLIQALEDAAKIAEKHAKNWESGIGKWASNDIADQIRALTLEEEECSQIKD